jgi:hypothetical protein
LSPTVCRQTEEKKPQYPAGNARFGSGANNQLASGGIIRNFQK